MEGRIIQLPNRKRAARPKRSKPATGRRRADPASYDLARIYSETVRLLKDEQGLTQKQIAELLEVGQSTVSRLLDEEQQLDPRLSQVSALLRNLQETPGEFFARHPLIRELETEARVRPKEVLYDRFRAILSQKEAEELLDAMEALRSRGRMQGFLAAARLM